MTKKILTGTIDVSKIDKSRLYQGKKGTYLNIAIVFSDEVDQYNNNGFIVESISKQERENGTKGTIIGNVKFVEQKKQVAEIPEEEQNQWAEYIKQKKRETVESSKYENDLPF